MYPQHNNNFKKEKEKHPTLFQQKKLSAKKS
jgi:hypothetical protein